MPEFTTQVSWVDVEVDIDVEEFFEKMSDEDCEEMSSLLAAHGFENKSSGRASWEFDEAIIKLKKNYYSLTNEEVDIIVKLAKRF